MSQALRQTSAQDEHIAWESIHVTYRSRLALRYETPSSSESSSPITGKNMRAPIWIRSVQPRLLLLTICGHKQVTLRKTCQDITHPRLSIM